MSTRRIRADVHKIKKTLTEHIKSIVDPKLRESGYANTVLCYFGTDEDKQPIGYKMDEDGDFEVQGFVNGGIISDAYGGGLATIEYDGMGAEQLLFVLEIAEEHGDDLI